MCYIDSMALEAHDHLALRCPRLGGEVNFGYCRQAGAPFCVSLIACWAVRLDIGQFLADHYTAQEIQSGLRRPDQTRIQRIVGIARDAQTKTKA